MEIELKSQSDNEMVFIVRDAEVPFINAIRRVAMVNVPKIAIEDVNIIKNDSAMFNEVLAHRLGLTPLVSDLDALEGLPLPEDDGWQEYTSGIMFHLNEVGPKVVYSKDLISSDSKIKPVYDTIPLVKLKEDMQNGCRQQYVHTSSIPKLPSAMRLKSIMTVPRHVLEVF